MYSFGQVYAHVDDVVVVNVAQTPCVASKLPITEKSFIHQVRLCALQESVFIVVASDNGVQVRFVSLSLDPSEEHVEELIGDRPLL